MKFSLIKTGAAAILASAVLVACGGGGGDQYATVSSNAVVTLDPTTKNALDVLSGKTLKFNTLNALDIPGVATLAVTGTGEPYGFNITDTENPPHTVTGELTVGSCKFKVLSSPFVAPHKLAQGSTFAVSPCNLNFATANKGSTGASFPAETTLDLSGSKSDPFTVTVSVAPGGTTLTITTPNKGTVAVVVPTLTGGN